MPNSPTPAEAAALHDGIVEFLKARPYLQIPDAALPNVARLLKAAGALQVGTGYALPDGTPAGVWVEEVARTKHSEAFVTPTSPAKPRNRTAQRQRPEDRLAQANGDTPPRLNGGAT